MARVLFVTGGAGGVGVENLQHRGAAWRSIGCIGTAFNIGLMRAATMSPTSDDLLNILLANRTDVIPGENSITVQGIREKSQSEAAAEAKSSMDGLQAYSTDA
jgi:hypothetical protein